MNCILGKILLIGWFCTSLLSAQSLPWTIQAGIGASFYAGDLSSPLQKTPHAAHLAQHLAVVRHFSARWALGLRLDRGILAADDRQYADDYRQLRALRFKTPYTSLSIPLTYVIGPGSKLSTSLSLGPGYLSYQPAFDYSFSRASDLGALFREDALGARKENRFQIFLGAGLSWRLTHTTSFRLGITAVHAFTDYLDGVSLSARPEDKDWYGTAEAGIAYRFGRSDRDGDGIADRRDRCLNTPGLAEMQGCPDTDRDGLADWEDNCPLEAGMAVFAGCPDTDGDGTPDFRDLCPTEAGSLGRNGCPNPQIDTDQDGITDPYDLCPDQAGPRDRGGCPAIDSDRDGLLDEDDHCPQVFGLAVFYGCPDSDGDGIADDRDACPTLFGVYADGGCPAAASVEEMASQLSTQYVPFLPQSSKLSRIPLLEKLRTFLLENPQYHLRLRGFADGTGDEADDMNLATQRALIIRDYLVENGVPTERITYEGLGARMPARVEWTQADREQNRRVTFELQKS